MAETEKKQTLEEKKQALELQGKEQASLVVNNALIDGLLATLKEKEACGLTFPKDYNPSNALMGAYLILKETVDKNGECVLKTCTQNSVANTLMDMVTMGLYMQKKQCYPVAFGGKLQCMVSYHGQKAMARRYSAKNINAEVIYEGDIFKYRISDGIKILEEHTQDFTNIDLTKIKGAYCVVVFEDGTKEMEVMNISQLKTAWKKGYGYRENSGVHTDFSDMMAKKTIVSRMCKKIVQEHGDAVTQEVLDKSDELNEIDITSENVSYEIKQNANSVDFDMEESDTVSDVVETEVEAEVEKEVKDKKANADWMK